MGLLDLHADELQTAAVNARVAPPAPQPKFSAWSAVPRALGVAAGEVGATAADLAHAMAYARDATPEQNKQIAARGLPDEAYSSELGDTVREYWKQYKPDPQTATTAEQLLFGFSRAASKVVLGAVTGGPFGVAAAAGEEGFTASDELRQKGVDVATRSAVGVVQGAGLGLAALPVLGQTLAGTAALYVAGGPGGFIAQQALTRKILQDAQHPELAAQYDPFDPVGLAVASLVPAAFVGGAHALRARVEPRVGTPTAPEPIPQEAIDAALVTHQQEVRQAASLAEPADLAGQAKHDEALAKAEQQMAAGEPVRVNDIVQATDSQVIEARLRNKINSDFDAAVREYATFAESDHGRILNTDTARELSPDYLANRTLSAAVHEPASQFVKDLYARKLAEAPAPGQDPVVLFTAGGTGAGKSTAIQNLPALAEANKRAQIIYDTNMNGYASSKAKVDQALAAGKDAVIALVARDPEDALVNGALPRAESQRRKFGTGRTVPVDEHIKTHVGAIETVKRLAAEYANDPRVQVRIIDNSLGKGNAVERPVSWLNDLRYNDVEQRVRAALEREREAGKISADTYAGFAGRTAAADARSGGEPSGVSPPDRVGSGEGTQPGRGKEVATGAESVAITERGTRIRIHWAAIEASDLVTSHTNDLRPNPAFPSELQPRDRARAASEQQIASIANNIQPELLGDSPKASDGAPIVGRDGVVESGNARTIALRRAYETGKAEGYRAWAKANAERFGIDPAKLDGMREPVLVRVGEGDYNRAEFARLANESAVASMSQSEQAKSDAARLPDLGELHTADDGSINVASSGPFIRSFMQTVAPTERGALMTGAGELSQQGVQRIRNAVFSKAYGDAELVAMMAESTDANVKNILSGMMRAAPEVAKVRDLMDAGARPQADITGPLVEAVRKFSQLRADGMKVGQFLSQRGMFGDEVSPEVASLMQALEADSRAPKRVADMIGKMAEAVDSLGDPRQSGMFDDTPSITQAVAEAAERASIDARLADIQEATPNMLVQMDGMDAPVRLADFLAGVKREADAMREDAPDFGVAADCFLTNGA